MPGTASGGDPAVFSLLSPLAVPLLLEPLGRGVGVFEHVQGLDHPAELGQGTGEAGGAGAALQRAQDRRGDDGTGPQRGGEPADLVPVGVLVRTVSPAPNERDRAGQTGESPMTSL